MKHVIISVMMILTLASCQNETKIQSNSSIPIVPTENNIEHSTDKTAIEKLLFAYRDAFNASDVNKV